MRLVLSRYILAFTKFCCDMNIEPIAHIRSDFPEKFGIPRQSGLADSLLARIVFEAPYRTPDALRGLEDFDYIWLLWEFSANRRFKGDRNPTPSSGKSRGEAVDWQPTVRPPRLGGNRSMGVFATRSPFRPNPLGLSSVKIKKIDYNTPEGPVIWVSGTDLMDGTPIYDIKPYIRYADSHPEARSGYVDSLEERSLEVHIPEELRRQISSPTAEALIQVLELDPRPSYQDDPQRVYGLSFAGMNIHFTVSGKLLTVLSID